MWQWCLRGSVEPTSICVEDFVQGVLDEGEFAGIPFINLKENYGGQKGKSLSLRNPTMDVENTRKKTFPCPYNSDPLSCYQTTLKLIKMMPDSDTVEGSEGGRRLFRKPASKAELQLWAKEGHPEWQLSAKKSRVIGKSNVNKILKNIAVLCKYDNPEKCTAHGKRRGGISVCANQKGGCHPQAMKQLGGHTHLDTAIRYVAPDQQAYDDIMRTKAGSPNAIRNQLASADTKPKAIHSKDNYDCFSDDDLTDLIRNMEEKPKYPEDDRKPAARSTIWRNSSPDKQPFMNRTNLREEKPRRVSDQYSSSRHSSRERNHSFRRSPSPPGRGFSRNNYRSPSRGSHYHRDDRKYYSSSGYQRSPDYKRSPDYYRKRSPDYPNRRSMDYHRNHSPDYYRKRSSDYYRKHSPDYHPPRNRHQEHHPPDYRHHSSTTRRVSYKSSREPRRNSDAQRVLYHNE